MRGTCGIAKRLLPNGEPAYCGKPSVGTDVPCSCDRCEAEPGFHRGVELCAEHYDEHQAKLKRRKQ